MGEGGRDMRSQGGGEVNSSSLRSDPLVRFTRHNGDFDEVVADGAAIHIERMNDGHIWMVISSGGKTLTLNFYTSRLSKHIAVSTCNEGFVLDGTPHPESYR